jgi:protein-tyrosine-phosphatase
VHVLGEYAGRDESRSEVSDPFGSDLASYRQTFDELQELIDGVVSRVTGKVR